MTDTHTHLYMEDFDGEKEDAVRRAIDAGVGMMIFPAVSHESNRDMISLAEKFPQNTRFCVGLHPTELGEAWRSDLDCIEMMLNDPRVVAIGETGIDLHWDKSNLKSQQEAFARQLTWAADHNLPLIIHCRDGVEETLEVIGKFNGKLPVMIFHSFTSGISDVRRIREVCDPYFGINGVVTFKNAESLREALPEIGIERIVLETDAPYLSPVPYRGTRNESRHIPIICNKVAEVLGISTEEAEHITDRNAAMIFGFKI